MKREVDLVSYLPPFIKEYKEPVAALQAEDPEFSKAWEAVDEVLRNHFISTADEYGIARREKLLGIYPSEDASLESRRARVQNKWFNRMPYTLGMFSQKIAALFGDTDFKLSPDFACGYKLTITTCLEQYGQVAELEDVITSMMPCNIAVDAKNHILCETNGTVFTSGGICNVNSFFVTNDFREINDLESKALFGGSAADTAVIKVSQNFNEVVRADSNASVASGVVRVDFVEIKTMERNEREWHSIQN